MALTPEQLMRLAVEQAMPQRERRPRRQERQAQQPAVPILPAVLPAAQQQMQPPPALC
ncbi:src substrate cortactin [Chlorella sorokiniana]|uniref:Src substrate cortactin n=1 Tax=Chlorella sorokiniana TaxID=3076 RepID=A0A2P6TPM8_CHLSO|nr:src substrate cortactin [Chlorella sorokiniana]|eukprot:PRW55992.1 src substrate cortactin [Chlorella sorokiniana]